MVLAKGERLAIAFLLFGLAILIFGIRANNALTGYEYAKKMTNALKSTISFVETNLSGLPAVDVDFNIFGNKDTLHFDMVRHRITSKRHFEYTVNGYRIVCSVEYDKGSKYYIITCGVD